MIYPMKVFDKNGKLIKIMPSKELKKEYWDKYWEGETSRSFTSTKILRNKPEQKKSNY